MISVRRAEEKDMPKINDLLMQVCLIHHLGRPDLFKYGAKKYTDSQLAEIIKNDQKPVFVATDETDSVIGYAFCMLIQYKNDNIMTDIKTLYIDDLCVDREMRRQHIGETLYNHVVAYAKKQGCYNVTLNVWSQNPDAMKFYEKCGLKPKKTEMEAIL